MAKRKEMGLVEGMIYDNDQDYLNEFHNIDTVKPGECLSWAQVKNATTEQKINHCGLHPLIFNGSVSKLQRIATFYCRQPDCLNCQRRKYDHEAKQIERVFDEHSDNGVIAGIVAKNENERTAIVRRLDGQYLSIPIEDGVLILSNNRHSRKKDQYIEFTIDQISTIMEKRELATGGNYSGNWWTVEEKVDEDNSESKTFMLPRIVPIPRNARHVHRANAYALKCMATRDVTLANAQAHMIESFQLVADFLNKLAGEQKFRLSYENGYEHTITQAQIDSGKVQAARIKIEIAGFQGKNKHDAAQREMIKSEFRTNVIRPEYETRKLAREQIEREVGQPEAEELPIEAPEAITADSPSIDQNQPIVPASEVVAQNGHGLNGSEIISPPEAKIVQDQPKEVAFTVTYTDKQLDAMGFSEWGTGRWMLGIYTDNGGYGDLEYKNGVLREISFNTEHHKGLPLWTVTQAGTKLIRDFFEAKKIGSTNLS